MWAVIETNGAVTYHEDEATPDALRKVFGGFRSQTIGVDPTVGAQVLIAQREGLDANFPAGAILSGHQEGWEPLLGPVAFVPHESELPTWLVERLDDFNRRAQ